MIIAEKINVKGKELVRHESDSGKMIRQIETGREYASAVDVIPCKYTYEETDKDVPRKGVTADEAGTA
ncbi:MAG: hypothetical protein J6V09_02905 [Clostridia bacterium]|nr:hypothetical protein [Clostridia bacterium]